VDVLLREVRTRPDGRAEYVDTEISKETIVVGASADCTVQLLGDAVAPLHAELRKSAAKLALRALGRAKIVAGERAAYRHTLDVGDTFAIGGHAFTLIEAPAGFDAALELRRDTTVPPSAYEAAFRTELTETWLGKRAPAWALFLLVAALCLAVPFALRYGGFGESAGLVSWLPGDVQWTTGPLLPAHQLAIGDDCASCHGAPFERVRDDACETCHTDLADHFHADLAVDGAVERCALCHREHNEPGTLVVTADSLCTDCHSREQPTSQQGRVDVVTGFDEATHPTFDAHLLASAKRASGTGFAFDWRFVETPLATAKEASNLEFPHDVHLDAEKVTSERTSEALGCGDCHALSPDQEHFVPVTMERHCSECHDLKFDETDPERQLPHGEPLEAILAIEGHFLKKYGDPDADRAERERRRLPDRDNADERCTGAAFDCATRRTLAEAVNQFTVRGCVTCHAVEDNGNKDVYSRFQVLPIRLVADYFPGGRFDHADHLTQKDKTGDAACESCHDARASAESADLLIPDIDNCTACHGESAPDRVALGCIECHAYHPGATLRALRELKTP
jgi:predicted CXXCH cytochrome family protein